MQDDMYSTVNLNAHLKRIHDWSVCWKMLFNLDITKPVHEITFTNRNSTSYDPVNFNIVGVQSVGDHKHSKLILIEF